MKFLISALAIFVAVCGASNAQVSCQQVVNVTYCNNGLTFQRNGNFTYDNRGNSWQRSGNYIYGSDGTTYNAMAISHTVRTGLHIDVVEISYTGLMERHVSASALTLIAIKGLETRTIPIVFANVSHLVASGEDNTIASMLLF